jgi:hypothetical protein
MDATMSDWIELKENRFEMEEQTYCLALSRSAHSPERPGLLGPLVSKQYTSVTISVEQTPPQEVDSYSASQEIPFLSWNRKDLLLFSQEALLVPILSQMNPVRTFSPYFLTHFNVFLHIPRSPEGHLYLF